MARPTSTAEAVLAAEQARRKAMASLDKKALEILFTDDFVYVHASGRIEDKATYIGALGTGVNRYTDYASNDIGVKVNGDTALVYGELLATGVSGQAPVVGRFRFSGFWVRTAEAWRLSYYQHTKFKTA